MADTRDPNKIVRPGSVQTAWITPDGKYITTDRAEAKAKGATNEVAASKAIYADGRIQWIVYTGDDRSLSEGTYSPAGPQVGEDPDTKQTWDRGTESTQKQTDQSERRKVSVSFEGSGPARKRRTTYETGPDMVEDAPEGPASQTPKDKEEQRQREKNAALPADQDPAYETDEERRKRGQDTIDRQGREAKAADDKKRQDAQDARQATLDKAAADERAAANARATAAANKPDNKTESIKGGDGKNYTRVTTVSADGKSITVKNFGPDGKEVAEIPGDSKNSPLPKGAPRFRPDFSKDDLGLSDYNQALQDAFDQGLDGLDRETAAQLMEQAGEIATVADRRRAASDSRASTQRQQDLGEVQSRRNSADNQFQNVNSTISKYGATLIPSQGSGQTVVDAYRAMLGSARDNVDAAGGYATVPQVGAPGAAPIPGSESTQVVMHPGGRIEVSPAGAAPPTPAAPVAAPAAAPSDVPASPPTGMPGYDQPVAPSVNPPAGEEGNDPTKSVGLFDPHGQVESLVAMGFDPAEAQNIASLYARGVRGDHL